MTPTIAATPDADPDAVRVPIVIAHRGASAYVPEHTLEAKAMAHAMGADFLEQDVVLTRDARAIVLHDLYLEDITDVARRFPDRACRRALVCNRFQPGRDPQSAPARTA